MEKIVISDNGQWELAKADVKPDATKPNYSDKRVWIRNKHGRLETTAPCVASAVLRAQGLPEKDGPYHIIHPADPLNILHTVHSAEDPDEPRAD